MNGDLAAMLATLKQDPGIVWAPIRHHSPMCAQMVHALVEQVQPDAVLIEGPSEANHLMAALQAHDARPPLSLYLYAIGAAVAGVRRPRFRCFAPLAAMSPEWVALRTAARCGAEARFIDLPYGARLDLPRYAEPASSDHEPLLTDDTLLAEADPTRRLVEHSNCRDFDEWWDRCFESGARTSDPTAYFDNMHRFCLLLRSAKARADIETDAREAFMAAQIASWRERGATVVVVTGGFHPYGIQRHLIAPGIVKSVPRGIKSDVHLVPYTLDRLDRANGYAAGIPHAGYYDDAYRALSNGPESAYAQANLAASLRIAAALRQRGYLATMPDTIELNVMADRLGQMRGVQAGRPELLDAVQACLLKDVRGPADSTFDQIVGRVLQGNAIGSLPNAVTVAPLVADLHLRCKRLKLPLRALKRVERSLDIYRSARHREVSQLLHQLQFLSVPYATLINGPDFVRGNDLRRVREIWEIDWQVETESTLTERSHLGATLPEAALNFAVEQSGRRHGSGLAQLLIECLRMGLHDLIDGLIARLRDWIVDETDPALLCQALAALSLPHFARNALGAERLDDRAMERIESLQQHCFERTCVRLPWIGDLPEERLPPLIDALAAMHGMTMSESPWANADLLMDAFAEVVEADVPAAVRGLATASLHLHARFDVAAAASVFDRTFGLVHLEPSAIGAFLQGFLRLGRAALIQTPLLLETISQLLTKWDEEGFLDALPDLRLAFTQLSPRESASLSRSLVGEERSDPTTTAVPGIDSAGSRYWSEPTLSAAARLRDQVTRTATLWGLDS